MPEPSGNLSSNLSSGVTREVLHRDAKTGLWSSTSEVAYYVANSAVSACLAATAIRHHWNVENSLHYTRDVTFQEDQSRIRRNPGVFARLRSFAYNVLCRNRTSTFGQAYTPPLSLDSCPGRLVLQLRALNSPAMACHRLGDDVGGAAVAHDMDHHLIVLKHPIPMGATVDAH